MPYTYTVNIPATSANLGACFDFAGIAIPDLYNTVEACISHDKNTITIDGLGANAMPKDESNLIYRTFKRAYEYAGKDCPFINMHCINRIPFNRGLGSSAAATLGGIFMANEMLSGILTKNDILKIACEFEGHPDNAAPAIFGGAVIMVYIDGQPIIRHIKLPKEICVSVAIPEIMLPTSVSRSILPETYSQHDIIAAMSTAASVVDALRCGDYELMGKLIMQDIVHHPYRKNLITGYDDVVNASLKAGAYGCVISGAGSAMISYCKDKQTAENVKSAMVGAFISNGIEASGFSSIIK